MAFRSRRTFTRRPRKRAIWVNIPFGGVNFAETSALQLLLTPEDWEAQFTALAMEHAVLRAVVGEITISQTTAGTAGGNMFWGIYKSRIGMVTPPVFTVTGMGEVDWLRVGARVTSSSVTATLVATTTVGSQPIDIRTKRKLTSQDAIYFVAQYAGDAAAPAGVASGILRFLVARD